MGGGTSTGGILRSAERRAEHASWWISAKNSDLSDKHGFPPFTFSVVGNRLLRGTLVGESIRNPRASRSLVGGEGLGVKGTRVEHRSLAASRSTGLLASSSSGRGIWASLDLGQHDRTRLEGTLEVETPTGGGARVPSGNQDDGRSSFVQKNSSRTRGEEIE